MLPLVAAQLSDNYTGTQSCMAQLVYWPVKTHFSPNTHTHTHTSMKYI